MQLNEALGVAARALAARKVRSALTVVSITIGAFSIVLMTSLAESGLQTLKADIEEVGGARLMLLMSKEPETAIKRAGLSPGTITRDDVAALDAALPHLEAHSTYLNVGSTEVRSGDGKSMVVDLLGADEGFVKTLSFDLERGRGLMRDDVVYATDVCVVAGGVAKTLFGGDAVGKRLDLGSLRCLIVGQLVAREREGIGFGFDEKILVLVPSETIRLVSPKKALEVMVQMKTVDAAKNDIVKRIANAILDERHHGVDDFRIYDNATMMEKFEGIIAILKLVVGLIAGIALAVGGVGIMNMMFVSVSERVREIGIRKALGAGPRAIAAQFLIEAALLSCTGGIVGVVAGAGAAVGAGAFIHTLKPAWVTAISVPAVVVALTASCAIGIVFGFVPARRASRLDPVAAMRR